jgi:hypothetical protein
MKSLHIATKKQVSGLGSVIELLVENLTDIKKKSY